MGNTDAVFAKAGDFLEYYASDADLDSYIGGIHYATSATYPALFAAVSFSNIPSASGGNGVWEYNIRMNATLPNAPLNYFGYTVNTNNPIISISRIPKT